MSRRAGLPGHGGLFGLFHQAPQADFGGAKQLWVFALHERGQEYEQCAIMPRREQKSLEHRIGSGQGGERSRFFFVFFAEQVEFRRVTEKPGEGNFQGPGQGFQHGGRGIKLLRLQRFQKGQGNPGSLSQGRLGTFLRQSPGAYENSDVWHGADLTASLSGSAT